MLQYNQRLIGKNFAAQQRILFELVELLIRKNILATNTVVHRILANLESIQSVADMAAAVGISPRHLQRLLKQGTGFSPHDLLKVLRLQRSLKGDSGQYADQSHFINAFRKATGYTPGQFARKFDV